MKTLAILINFITIFLCMAGLVAIYAHLASGFVIIDKTALVVANIALVGFGLWAVYNIWEVLK